MQWEVRAWLTRFQSSRGNMRMHRGAQLACSAQFKHLRYSISGSQMHQQLARAGLTGDMKSLITLHCVRQYAASKPPRDGEGLHRDCRGLRIFAEPGILRSRLLMISTHMQAAYARGFKIRGMPKSDPNAEKLSRRKQYDRRLTPPSKMEIAKELPLASEG